MARKGRMSHDNFARRMKKWNIDLPAAENVAEIRRIITEKGPQAPSFWASQRCATPL